jgi:hypothetical protein
LAAALSAMSEDFLAAIFMRGIDYIQVPTTLLAQVDSSVGGKTGVNLQHGKNLVGSFHHPLAVFADIEVLQTLPPRELRAGLFRKHQGRHYSRRQDSSPSWSAMPQPSSICDPASIEYVVAASIKMKAEVVGIDELETGLRMILNYGHTLGHAIEAATRYKKLLHGEAIAWGMIAATRLGLARKTITPAQAARIEKVILEYGPLPALRLAVDRLLDAATRDKKNRSGVRRFVLPSGIGNAVVVEDVSDAELHAAAESMLQTARRRFGDATPAEVGDKCRSPGAKPAGVTDETAAAAAVREMFDGIAPRYDTLNHILSLNIDRLVVVAHGAAFSRGSRPARCGGSRSLLRHRRHDSGAASSASRPVMARRSSPQTFPTRCWCGARPNSLNVPQWQRRKPSRSRRMRCICPLPTTPSISSRPPSASGIWPTTAPASTSFIASCARGASSESSISASPAACLASYMPSISAAFCPRSARAFRELRALTLICPTRSTTSRLRRRCWG